MAIEIAYNLHHVTLIRRSSKYLETRSECAEYWTALSKSWTKEFHSKRQALAPKHFGISLEQFFAEEIPLSKMIEWHGLEGLFKEHHSQLLSVTHVTAIENCLYRVFEETIRAGKKKVPVSYAPRLHEIGRLFLQAKLPVVSGATVGNVGFPSHLYYDAKVFRAPRLEPSTLFGVICGSAVFLELSFRRNMPQQALADSVKGFPIPLVRDVLSARLQGVLGTDLTSAIAAEGFSPEEELFISSWIRKEISLVIPANSDSSKE